MPEFNPGVNLPAKPLIVRPPSLRHGSHVLQLPFRLAAITAALPLSFACASVSSRNLAATPIGAFSPGFPFR
jgi:hypothetical protein